MHSTNLRKVGGSVMLAIPPTLLDLLQLKSGERINLSVERGRLVVHRKRPKYSMEQLLKQTKSAARASWSREDREWTSGKAVGRELI